MDRSPLYRDLARVEKARQLAEILTAARCTAADVLVLDDEGWNAAAKLASIKRRKPMSPPSDATKSLVWHRLAERERLAGENPLVGIGTRG